MCDCFQHVVAILDRIDALEFLVERLRFRGVDSFLLHPARVIIAYFLCFRREARIDTYALRFFRDVLQGVVVVLDQLVETAPARIFRRNLSPLDPAAIGVHEKIILRFRRCVPVSRIERLRFLDVWCDCSAPGRF
jgi:hypothetical protein